MVAITFQNVQVNLTNTTILKHLNLSITSGEMLAIVGRSGCGKSVLLKALMGIVPLTHGTILLDGVPMHLPHPATRMGMAFQGGALFDSMHCLDNVLFPLLAQSGQWHVTSAMEKKAREALDWVSLTKYSQHTPDALSGGMRKRLAIARLIAQNPSIFLYDEPTTGLDPATAFELAQLIEKTHKEFHCTTLMVTHDLATAVRADRIALHDGGKIAHITDRGQCFSDANPTLRHFFSLWNIDDQQHTSQK